MLGFVRRESPVVRSTRLWLPVLAIFTSVVGLGWSLNETSKDSPFVSPQAEPSHFIFARVQFTPRSRGGRWGGRRGWGRTPGWAHDYPRAERNFLKILGELTSVETSPESYVIVRLDDPRITEYPFLYFSEPGTWDLTEVEVQNLRKFFQKGGFAMFDDFDGMRDWEVFHYGIRQVLPDQVPELLTLDDPIFHCFYDIETLDMIPPQQYRERPLFYGLRDESGRLQAIINFNNDLGDFWEWSDETVFPISLSNEAYKFGVNYVIYALSH